MGNSDSSEERTQALVIHLAGADIFIIDGTVHGEHIGTLVRREDRLVSAWPARAQERRCNRCSSNSVLVDMLGDGRWELLCVEHGDEGEWMTHTEMDQRLRQMIADGKDGSVVCAFFNWAIKRLRG
jgi:hypothetical protein